MFLVAIGELGTSVEDEATALAKDLALTAFESRLLLAEGMPAIVLRTPDRARALALLAALRGRGHEAVACDAAAVVALASMTSVDDFEFGALALRSGGADLPYDDVLVLLPMTRKRKITTTEKTTETKFRIGAAIATGGIVMSKKVTHEVTRSHEDREQLLCAFRKTTQPPWLLTERGLDYARLGPSAAHGQSENFLRVVAMLRERTPRALYDDRLLRFRKEGGDKAADALLEQKAHVLALLLARRARHQG